MNNIMNSINTYNTSVAQSSAQAKAKSLQSSLENIKNSTDEEMMEVCKSFEAYFLEQVFNSMEKTIMKSKDDGMDTGYVGYFKSMLTQEYAKNATEAGGYGIAQMLYESMKRKY